MTFQSDDDPSNIFNLDYYQSNGYPHAAWTRLRKEDPIYRCEDKEVGPFWAVTRHADIVAVERDSRTFSNASGVTIMKSGAQGQPDLSALIPMLLMMDPPKHGKHRGVVRDRFTPPAMKGLEQHIVSKSREIIDDVARHRVDMAAEDAEADFVTSVAARLPMDVILELLGVPTSDRDQMFVWSNAVVGSQDPDYGDVDTPFDAAMEARAGLFRYFSKHVTARRADPGDDLVSLLAGARIEGEPLSDLDILGYCFLLVLAGNETTRNATSGALIALLEHPAAMRDLASDDSLMPGAVEELLRWVAPIVYMGRTCTTDVMLGGRLIGKGERLALFYPSANRDDAVFQNPFDFDIRRTPNDHLTFGFGRHRCLGNDLARIELAAVIGQVIHRFPNIRIAGPIDRLRSNFVGGIKRLPVHFG